MKQTALRQLEKKLDILWENDENFSLKLLDEITSIIEELKPIERQQIEDAFAKGYNARYAMKDGVESQTEYLKTLTQD